MLKRGDKTLASVLRERKGKDFTRRAGGRVRGMGISGEKQQGQGTSSIVMMMF